MYKHILIAVLAAAAATPAVSAMNSPAPVGPAARSPADPANAPVARDAEAEALRTQLAEAVAENRRDEALIRELRGEISILQATRSTGPTGRLGSSPLPVSRAVLRELLGRRETVGWAMDWIKADLRMRYASLIALQTRLTEAQRRQLLDLLAERYAARMDLAATETTDLPPQTEIDFDTDYHAKLVRLVGEEGAARFEKSEVKPVSWDRMQRLDLRLRYEASPLTVRQYAALWTILSQAVFYYRAPATQAEADALIQRRTAGDQAALAQAAGVLDATQLRVLDGLLQDDRATWRVQLYLMIRGRQRQAPNHPPGDG